MRRVRNWKSPLFCMRTAGGGGRACTVHRAQLRQDVPSPMPGQQPACNVRPCPLSPFCGFVAFSVQQCFHPPPPLLTVLGSVGVLISHFTIFAVHVFSLSLSLVCLVCRVNSTTFACPLHKCANCAFPQASTYPLVRCIRCPIAYHTCCVPAGCLREVRNVTLFLRSEG